jgi:hypothetical protein
LDAFLYISLQNNLSIFYQFIIQMQCVYVCDKCQYSTSNKTDFTRHTMTLKHHTQTDDRQYICECKKKYKHLSSLCAHRKKCIIYQKIETPNDVIIEILKQNQEFKELLIEQSRQIVSLTDKVEKGVITNNTTNHFNLQIFLNEKCKDALNIMDFVHSLKINLNDLETVGKLGYSEGISKIFIRELKELDVFKRPIHCSDAKREILYVRDKDAWEKENEDNNKMKLAIKYIANRNVSQITEWVNKNPAANDYESITHVEYIKILSESLGGYDEKDNFSKIIRNVAKEVVIVK